MPHRESLSNLRAHRSSPRWSALRVEWLSHFDDGATRDCRRVSRCGRSSARSACPDCLRQFPRPPGRSWLIRRLGVGGRRRPGSGCATVSRTCRPPQDESLVQSGVADCRGISSRRCCHREEISVVARLGLGTRFQAPHSSACQSGASAPGWSGGSRSALGTRQILTRSACRCTAPTAGRSSPRPRLRDWPPPGQPPVGPATVTCGGCSARHGSMPLPRQPSNTTPTIRKN
jgi:hypothetical protein